jgi:GTPase SAR1 family protein
MIDFIHPSNILIVGPSGSGKTTCVLRIIENKMLTPFPEKIYYLYNIKQDFMSDFPQIKFVQGLNLDVIGQDKTRKLLIIDDLMLQTNKELGEQFIVRTRHLNCTTIFLTHELYRNHEMHRLISNNTHYFIILGNRRQAADVRRIGRQLEMVERMSLGYKYAVSKSFGNLCISLHPSSKEDLTIICDIFEKWSLVFPKD